MSALRGVIGGALGAAAAPIVRLAYELYRLTPEEIAVAKKA